MEKEREKGKSGKDDDNEKDDQHDDPTEDHQAKSEAEREMAGPPLAFLAGPLPLPSGPL